MRLGVGQTWGCVCSVGGARKRSSGRGVMTVSSTLLAMMLNLRVEARTRGGAEFETTLHSGCLSFEISGYYVV